MAYLTEITRLTDIPLLIRNKNSDIWLINRIFHGQNKLDNDILLIIRVFNEDMQIRVIIRVFNKDMQINLINRV